MREAGKATGLKRFFRFRASAEASWTRWLVRSRSLRAYSIALATLLVALAIRSALDMAFPGVPPFVTLFPAVAFAGLFCGAAAGTAVATLGAAAACLLWLAPRNAFGPLTPGDAVSVGVFLLSSGLILWTTSWLRGALAVADNARTMLETALGLGDVGTWELDLATNLVLASGSTHGLHGIPDDGRVRAAAEWLAAIHPDDRETVDRALQQAVAADDTFMIEYRVPRPDGPPRRILSRGKVVSSGGRRRLVGTLVDITDRARAEERLRAQEVSLREALAAREMLVREADHRIKNSLQLVVSVLRLQRGRLTEPGAAAALAGAIARVEAVAQSHQALQGSEDLKTIDFGDALRGLCANLGQLSPVVEMRCGSEGGLELDAERAIPLALIVSELVTNAMRHAYPDGGGQVTVDAVASGETLVVTVSDQGVGQAADAKVSGLGSTVIRSLARQIGAEVAVRSKPGDGTTATVRLPHRATATAN